MPGKVIQDGQLNCDCCRCKIIDRVGAVRKKEQRTGLQGKAQHADDIKLYPVKHNQQKPDRREGLSDSK